MAAANYWGTQNAETSIAVAFGSLRNSDGTDGSVAPLKLRQGAIEIRFIIIRCGKNCVRPAVT